MKENVSGKLKGCKSCTSTDIQMGPNSMKQQLQNEKVLLNANDLCEGHNTPVPGNFQASQLYNTINENAITNKHARALYAIVISEI